jgi:hypothetical protein
VSRTGAAVAVVCAFACGLLAGVAATRERPRRGVREAAVRDSPRTRVQADRATGTAAVANPVTEAGGDPAPPARDDDAPDQPQYLGPTTEFLDWDAEAFGRWYEVHREAWDLPELEPEFVEKLAPMVLALGRIPRREVLMRIMAAMSALDEETVRLEADNRAWAEANPHAPRDHPERRAHRERVRAAQQQFFDRLHTGLAYSDYMLVFARQAQDGNMMDGLKERAPAGGKPAGADPYARPVTDARETVFFEAWYRAYRHRLGLPARDREYLWTFCENVVRPLGRLPEPDVAKRLVDAYDPFHAAAQEGRDDEAEPQRALLERLRACLSPLDFRRVRFSERWRDVATELGIERR